MGIAGFRYEWGTDNARGVAMSWLAGKGYRQAIWGRDLQAGKKQILSFLQKNGLSADIRQCPEVGPVYMVQQNVGK